MTEPLPEPEPDGSWRHVAVRPAVFRPGLFTALGLVGVIWAAALGAALRGRRLSRQEVEALPPRFVLASVLVLVVLSVWAVLRVVLTKIVVGGGEVVVRRPFTRSARFARGAATAAGPQTLAGADGGAVRLPTWWLLTPDVERLLASVESELGVRFPPGSRARPASRRRRRGDIEW